MSRPPWLVPLREASGRPGARCILLPPAAAGPSVLRGLAVLLPPDVEVLGLCLPGRERRALERATADLDEVLDACGRELRDREQVPTVVLGHSLGGVLAAALALAHVDLVDLVVVSGAAVGAADRAAGRPRDDHALLRAAGLTSPDVLGDGVLGAVVRTNLLVDRDLADRAAARCAAAVVPTRLLAVTGEADLLAPPEAVARWRHRTADFGGVLVLPGGHSYLSEPGNLTALAALVVRELRAVHPREHHVLS